MLSISRTQRSSKQHGHYIEEKKVRRDRRRLKDLRKKPDLSSKFREIVLAKNKQDFVGIFEVAVGGTFQRLRPLAKKDLERILGVTKAPAAPSETAKTNTDTSSSSTTARPERDAVLFGEFLRRHNIQRQRGRLRDTFGMINRDLVGPQRRIEITLTSKKNVDDAIKKIGRIIDAIARVWRNDDVFCIWVRALQDRGVWHFHLALYIGGRLQLTEDDKESIGSYVEQRWQEYADQDEPVQVAVRLPVTEEDLDILDAYDSAQKSKQKMTKAADQKQGTNADIDDDDHDDEVKITKKTKVFGIFRRSAYWRHVEVKRFVLHNVDDMFALRRLHRGALQSLMRLWRRPRRHRPHRFAVEARFHLPERLAMKLFDFVRRTRYGGNPPPPEELP